MPRRRATSATTVSAHHARHDAQETVLPSALALSLRELRHAPHAPLSRAEEAALAARWRERGDHAARERLVASHLRLVVALARPFVQRGQLNLADLIGEGNIALLHAVAVFDPNRGRLSTLATQHIRQRLNRACDERGSLVRVPVNAARVAQRYRATRERLERAGDSPPTEAASWRPCVCHPQRAREHRGVTPCRCSILSLVRSTACHLRPTAMRTRTWRPCATGCPHSPSLACCRC